MAQSTYRVLSQIKTGGKLREIGQTIQMDDQVAAALRPGILAKVAEKAPAPNSGASASPPAGPSSGEVSEVPPTGALAVSPQSQGTAPAGAPAAEGKSDAKPKPKAQPRQAKAKK